MNIRTRGLAALCAALAIFAMAPEQVRASGSCGNGSLDGGEECDGGAVGLFVKGDPAEGACTTGSQCYFRYTCCKFNCQYVGTPGVPCQDGDNCTGPDTCDQVGVCHGGPNVANGTPCDDGLFCTGTETCENGACVHAAAPCPGTACNQCQEDSDSCFNPAGSGCSDGSVCITGGSCDGAGSCTGGTFHSGPCDDGVFCNGTDNCNGGTCSQHSGDPCTGPDGDGNCTESCNEEAGDCSAADADGSACDDGLFCDGAADTCSAGVCSGTGTPSCDDDNSCTADVCLELTDSCTHTTALDGAACDDGQACTLDDTCSGGSCIGSPVTMEDLCPWTVVLRESSKADWMKTNFQVNLEGDVCGGSIRLGGLSRVGSDLVSAGTDGSGQLRLPADAVLVGDIVSAGAGAKAFPGSDHLPYLTPSVSVLAPGSLRAKDDGSGVYDLTGGHALATQCFDARASFPVVASTLDALAADDTINGMKLSNGSSTSIAAVKDGLNVIEIDGNLKAGNDTTITLDANGHANVVLVLRVTGSLQIKLRSAFELAGGLLPADTLLYVKGKKCALGDLAFGSGTLLCSPGRVKIGGGAVWAGAVFGDGRLMKIGEKAFLSYLPFSGF